MVTQIANLLFKFNTIGLEKLNKANALMAKMGKMPTHAMVNALKKIDPVLANQLYKLDKLSKVTNRSIGQISSSLTKHGVAFEATGKKGQGQFKAVNGRILEQNDLIEMVTGRLDARNNRMKKVAKIQEDQQRAIAKGIKQEVTRIKEGANAHTEAGKTALRASKDMGVGAGRIFNTMNKQGELVGGQLDKFNMKINKQGQFINKSTGEIIPYDKAVGKLGASMRKFQMQYLGVMFGAMQLKMTMQRLINPAMKVAGVFKIITATLQVLFLPIALEVVKVLIPISKAFMSLSRTSKLVIGAFALLAFAIFSVMFFGAQMMLFFGALKTMLISFGMTSIGAIIKIIAASLLLNPTFWVILAVFLVFIAVWISGWGKIRDVTDTFVNQLGRMVYNLVRFFIALFSGGDVSDAFFDLVLSIVGAFASLGAVLLTMGVGIVKALIDVFLNFTISVIGFWFDLGVFAGVAAKTMVEIWWNAFKKLGNLIGDVWSAIQRRDISSIGEIISKNISENIADSEDIFRKNLIEANDASELKETFLSPFEDIKSGVDSLLTDSMESFNTMVVQGVDAMNLVADYGVGPLVALQSTITGTSETFRKQLEASKKTNEDYNEGLANTEDKLNDFNTKLKNIKKPLEEVNDKTNANVEITSDQNVELESANIQYDNLPSVIDATSESLGNQTKKVENLTKGYTNLGRAASSAVSSGAISVTRGGITTAHKVSGIKIPDMKTDPIGVFNQAMAIKRRFSDFIWRAGSGPVAISPADNIMGVKSDPGGGGANVTVNFAPVITNEVASNIDIEELKRELSEILADEVETSIRRIRI